MQRVFSRLWEQAYVNVFFTLRKRLMINSQKGRGHSKKHIIEWVWINHTSFKQTTAAQDFSSFRGKKNMWSIFPQAWASAAKHVETKGICGPIGILELIKEHEKFSSPECIEVHCYPHILIYEYMTLVQPMESKQFLRSVKVKECAFLHSKLSYRHVYSILDSLFTLKKIILSGS